MKMCVCVCVYPITCGVKRGFELKPQQSEGNKFDKEFSVIFIMLYKELSIII